MSAYNHWTASQLLNDYHAGDPGEARMIIEENGLRDHEVCGRCGGPAHYKHTIGTHKCIECGALKFRSRDKDTGKSVVDWS